MPRSHTGEGATTILANIEECKQFLQTSTILFNCLEINPKQSKTIMRIFYELVKMLREGNNQ